MTFSDDNCRCNVRFDNPSSAATSSAEYAPRSSAPGNLVRSAYDERRFFKLLDLDLLGDPQECPLEARVGVRIGQPPHPVGEPQRALRLLEAYRRTP